MAVLIRHGNAEPYGLIANSIDQQARRTAVIGDQEICVTVIVDIAGRHAAADFRHCERGARLIAYVLKPPADVPEQLVSSIQRVDFRASRLRLKQCDAAVYDNKIQPAVVVVIQPGRAKPGKWHTRYPETRFGCFVVEPTAAVVNVERVGLTDEVSHENIDVAVAVEVSCIDAHTGFRHAIAIDRDAREWRFVHETHVFLVYPELVGNTVVGNVDVDPVVTVKIGRDYTQGPAVDLGDSSAD